MPRKLRKPPTPHERYQRQLERNGWRLLVAACVRRLSRRNESVDPELLQWAHDVLLPRHRSQL
jgi:hypothetical protein